MTAASRLFHPIPRSRERDQVLLDAAQSVADIYVKFSESQTLVAKALKFIPPFKLQLSYPESPRSVTTKPVTFQFSNRGDKYFSQAFVQDTGNQLFLVVEGPIYKVQRRQSFRLKLPADYPMQSQIFEMNGHSMNEKVQLLDISEGGCSLTADRNLHPTMGSVMSLTIKIGSRPPFVLSGHVRYLKTNKDRVQFGLKFEENNGMSSELFNLTRDLYVELFSKWARRR
jgi:hypothetical protein